MHPAVKYVGLAALLIGLVLLGREAYDAAARRAPSALMYVCGTALMGCAALILAMQATEGDSVAMRTRSRA